MSLIDDQVRVARDSFLSQVCLIIGFGFFALLLNTGHPLAAAASCVAALLGLFFFVDYIRIGHRLSRREPR